jgi:hypothetical protein
MPIDAAIVALWTSGQYLGSVFAGSVVGNLTSSFLWEGGKWVSQPLWDRIPELAALLRSGGRDHNHDLLRILRRAECAVLVSLCDKTLLDDYGLHPGKGPLTERLKARLRLAKDPDLSAIFRIRQAFAQTYKSLESISPSELVRLHGAALTDLPGIVGAGREVFESTNPDELRARVVENQVAALDRIVRGSPGRAGLQVVELRPLAPNGLPPQLRQRLEKHPGGWWDLLAFSFREELKDPRNGRGQMAWQVDVQSLLPQFLGQTYAEFERRFSAVDEREAAIWQDLTRFRQAFDNACHELNELLHELLDGQREVVRRLDEHQEMLVDIQAYWRAAMPGQMTWGDSPPETTAVAPAAATGPQGGARTRSGRVTTVSNIPYLMPRHFLGRENEIREIRRALRRHADRVAIVALIGMIGCGKSTLAMAYATRRRRDYRATWWLRAATESGMEADLTALGVKLGWVRPDEREDVPVAAILERLESDGDGILLVYDSVIEADALKPFLPRGGSAHVLVTSTATGWGEIAERITVRVWPKSVGAQFLLARAGVESKGEDAEKLSEACEGLPLALELAAAYCERLGISLSEYLRRFQREGVGLIDKGDSPSAFHGRRSVTRAYQLAIGDAAKRHPAAEPLMVHAALLAAEPIPLFLFREGKQTFGELLAGDGLDEAVATLRMFSLVDRGEVPDERNGAVVTDVIRLHRLVRDIAASHWTPEARESARRSLIEALATVYPADDLYVLTNWPRARRLDALAWALVGDDVALPPRSELAASELMLRLAAFRHASITAYAQARSLCERALSIRESVLGAAHPHVAQCLNNLGLLYWGQGDLVSARNLCERALAIREAAFGPQHAEVAESLVLLFINTLTYSDC